MPGDHPRSTLTIAGHPIHPMLVPFPIACFVGTIAGGFFLRLFTLRVGYFPPITGALRLKKR